MSAHRALLWAASTEGFICQQGSAFFFFFSSAEGVNDGSFSFSASSRAGNNPEITCRDDALMILVMKKAWIIQCCNRLEGASLPSV